MTPTVFEAGAGTAVVAARTLVLVDPTEPSEAGRLAALVDADAGVDELLAAGSCDLAIVRIESDAVVTVARGATSVDLVATEVRRIDGSEAARPVRVEQVERVALRLTAARGDDDRTFSVVEGVVPAVAVRREVVAGRAAATDGPAAPGGSDAEHDPFDAMFGRTVVRTVEDAAVRPRPDGRATVRPAVEPLTRPLGVLLFSTGERVVVDQPLVLGRNPDRAGARAVKVPGAGISRRHAAITVDRWCAQIDDLGSANGTEVTLPGTAPCRLAPGRPVGLVAGTRVDLGGEVSFVVEDVA